MAGDDGGASGAVLQITSKHVIIRNVSSNRRKRIPVDKAMAVPQPGSFIKAPNGDWHKVLQSHGNQINVQAVKVLPEDIRNEGNLYILTYFFYLYINIYIFAHRR